MIKKIKKENMRCYFFLVRPQWLCKEINRVHSKEISCELFYWPVYLGPVFLIDSFCIQTATDLTMPATFFLIFSTLPHPELQINPNM